MVIRVATVALWFVAIGWAFNYLNLMFGAPSIVMWLLAGAVSALVAVARFLSSSQVRKAQSEPAPTVAASTNLPARSSY